MKNIIKISLILIAIAIFALLQYQLWFGENGYTDKRKLKKDIIKQQQLFDEQAEANRVLREDVRDLKSGLDAVEEHARLDLGLIKAGETFIQISTTKGDNLVEPIDIESKPIKTIEIIPEPLVNLPKSDHSAEIEEQQSAEKKEQPEEKQAEQKKEKQPEEKKEKQPEQDKEKQPEEKKEKQAERNKEKDAEKKKEKEKQAERNKEKEAEKKKEKEKQAKRNKEKEAEKKKEKEKQAKRNKEKDAEKNKEKEKNAEQKKEKQADNP